MKRMSLRRAGDVGEWMGRLGYSPFAVRRAVVERQIGAAFPGLAEPEVKRIARESYAHLGRTTIETALLPACSREEVLDLVDYVEGWDVLERARAEGRGVMIVSGHLGNWELGGSYLAARGLALEAGWRGMQKPPFAPHLTPNPAPHRMSLRSPRGAGAPAPSPGA